MPTTSAAFPPEYFEKQDPSDDKLFYAMPRLVTHIDDGAIATLTSFYAEKLPDGAAVLDLMSSWISHLPEDKPFSEVLGHGMNSAELSQNPRLTEYFVQNLNQEATLPVNDNSLDAVLCAVSVQYLQYPLEVFGEVFRVLKPGGIFIISFSNRCFPTKAIKAWVHSGDQDHIGLVHTYFQFSAEWDSPAVRIKHGTIDPSTDPLCIMWAFKPSK